LGTSACQFNGIAEAIRILSRTFQHESMLYFKNAFDVSIQYAFYHFQSKSQAMQKIDEGEFFEWSI
jgi:hypothetical protein